MLQDSGATSFEAAPLSLFFLKIKKSLDFLVG